MRLAKLLYLVLCICNGKFVFSQPDSIWQLHSEKQVYTLLTWYYSDLAKKDSQFVISELVSVEKISAEKGNKLLQRQAWLLQQAYNAERNPDTEKSAAMMLTAANKAAEKNWPLTQAECWHFAGNFHFLSSNFTMAFEYMQKAQTVFDKYSVGQENFYLHRYENTLANCYYHFGEYLEAIKYLKKTIQLPAYWNTIIFGPALYNNLALCYQQLKQYDSAAIWFIKSHETAVAFKDSFYIVLAQGNLGFTYYLQQQYDKALPLLEADYKGSMQAGQTGSATNAAMTIADIHIKKNQPELAERYMNASRLYVYNSGNASLLKNWYQNLYDLARAKGDHKKLSLYADSLLTYKDTVAAQLDKKAFNQAVLRLETEKHKNEVNLLDNKRKQQVLFRNGLLAGLVLLALIIFLLLNRQSSVLIISR